MKNEPRPMPGELRFAGKVALAPILIGPLNVEAACGLSWRETLALAKRCGVRVAQSGGKRRRANEAKAAGGKKGGAIAGRGRPKALASREATPKAADPARPDKTATAIARARQTDVLAGDGGAYGA